jgi:hypothetical protein
MKKLAIPDPKGGEPTQVGFNPNKGHPVGITDKLLPFAHAWGARMLSRSSPPRVREQPADRRAYLLRRSRAEGQVASLAFGNPEDAFGQKRAAVIFRESWFFGWLKERA